MIAAARRFDRRLLLGILFICASGVLFPIMNGAAKFLGGEYNSLQVSWARAFGHIVFMLAAFLPRHGLALLRTRRPGVQLIRSLMLFLSNLCFFFALTYIPVAKAAAISMTSPLIVALLAWLDPQRLRRPRQVRASEVVAPPTVASVSSPPLAREEGGVPL